MNNCICSGDSINDIITQLASNKSLNNELKKIMHNVDYADDIIQDLYIQLLTKEKSNDIIRLCKENKLKGKLITIVKNRFLENNRLLAKNYNTNLNSNEQKIKDILSIQDNTQPKDFTILVQSIYKDLEEWDTKSTRLACHKKRFLQIIESDLPVSKLAIQLKLNPNTLYRSYTYVKNYLIKTYNDIYLTIDKDED